MFNKTTATILVTIITSISSFGSVQAQGNRLAAVGAFAQSQDAASKKLILEQPELRQELGITDATGADAEFKYDLAFQETFIRDDVTTGMTGMGDIVGQSSAVVVPFCKGRTCILATYDEDEETGALSLVGYGSSVRASRIAESYARLAKLRPGYKGETQIVDYPAGQVSFLMIDGQGPHGEVTKEFLHATDDQAARFGQEENAAQTVMLEDMAELIAKVDIEARQNSVQLGPLEETKVLDGTTQGSSVSHKTSEESIKDEILTVEQTSEVNVNTHAVLNEIMTPAAPVQTDLYLYVIATLLMLGLGTTIVRDRLGKKAN